MSAKQKKILETIFKEPAPKNITYAEVQALFKFYGIKIKKGDGSRRRANYEGHKLNFHKPHPQKELKKYAVEDVRNFLVMIGIKPE